MPRARKFTADNPAGFRPPVMAPLAFAARVKLAADCLRADADALFPEATRARSFEGCFEQYDGDQVIARLVNMAQDDRLLQAGIERCGFWGAWSRAFPVLL